MDKTKRIAPVVGVNPAPEFTRTNHSGHTTPRSTYNNTMSDGAPDKETGKRYMVRCCMPCPHDLYKDRNTVEQMIKELATNFGGLTQYPSTGYWIDGTGELLAEHGYVFEVSTPDAGYAEDIMDTFRDYGKIMGEEWIHLELHAFEAHHTRVN